VASELFWTIACVSRWPFDAGRAVAYTAPVSRYRVFLVLAVAALVVSDARAQSPADSGSPQAVPVSLPHPVYPPIAQSARVQGEVAVTVSVGADGSVASAQITGKDIPLLSAAAIDAAKKSTFECRGCVAAPASYTIVYAFWLEIGARSPEPDQESPSRSRVTTAEEAPLCDHCGGPHMPTAVRSAKCLWLWKCGVE
jgi:TonB family protein